MSVLVIATARDELRKLVIVPLSRSGVPVRPVADWESLCRAVCGFDTRLVLVDSELPGLIPEVLAGLSGSMSHQPRIRVMGAALPPLIRIPATERAARREAERLPKRGAISAGEAAELRWMGLGPEPMDVLSRLAASPLPLCVHGEKGTGKERIARWVHMLSRPDRPFVVVPREARWERVSGKGMLFLESAHRREPGDLRATAREASALGWRIALGTRATEAPSGVDWARVAIPPLRQHPGHIRPLCEAYLARHCQRMGMPTRSFDRSMWTLLGAFPWPGNLRELEMFVVHALAHTDAPVIRSRGLPETVARLLRPEDERTVSEMAGFETVAERQLRDVVGRYEPGPGTSLYDLVTGTNERVLLRLVLARTGGNRKAAAGLLGIARNTLANRSKALGLVLDERVEEGE